MARRCRAERATVFYRVKASFCTLVAWLCKAREPYHTGRILTSNCTGHCKSPDACYDPMAVKRYQHYGWCACAPHKPWTTRTSLMFRACGSGPLARRSAYASGLLSAWVFLGWHLLTARRCLPPFLFGHMRRRSRWLLGSPCAPRLGPKRARWAS